MVEGQPFAWIKGIGTSNKSWCPRCLKDTEIIKHENISYCQECFKIKGIIDND